MPCPLMMKSLVLQRLYKIDPYTNVMNQHLQRRITIGHVSCLASMKAESRKLLNAAHEASQSLEMLQSIFHQTGDRITFTFKSLIFASYGLLIWQ